MEEKQLKAEQEFTSLSQEERLYRIRHTFAHIMAEAVIELFPGTQCAIGPPIQNGFYYDFDTSHVFTELDLRKIEEKMQGILSRSAHLLIKKIYSRDKAKQLFREHPYKLELIDTIPEGDEISTYTVDTFVDLCRGPHVPNTKYLTMKACKLLSIAGAYWRGDEKRSMLQRIYATAWSTPKELRAHLVFLEEAEKRDHRKLGKELDLFSTHEEAGAGFIYWHPKGSRIRLSIEDYWRNMHLTNGYELLYTPHVGKSWLWETSGHLDFYKENMYAPMELDKSDYYVKPMNCPFHILIYQTGIRSYRDLPLRWAELGTVYRYERSGVLHGLLRVRGFTQDDAHIFCSPNQIAEEIKEVLRFSLQVWKDFGFSDIRAYLATRPEKAVGEKEDWDRATQALHEAAIQENVSVTLDEGGGAFYGPKIDLKVKDAIGREWQMSTIQFDFNLPNRFNLNFVDKDGVKKRPYMIHRALLGSLERFFGVLIEHYNGAFPVWLAPIQAIVIPVNKVHMEAAEAYFKHLGSVHIRVLLQKEEDTLRAKIRKAQLQKIPYMLIIGDREAESGLSSCRLRNGKQLNGMSSEEFIQFIKRKIDEKEYI